MDSMLLAAILQRSHQHRVSPRRGAARTGLADQRNPAATTAPGPATKRQGQAPRGAGSRSRPSALRAASEHRPDTGHAVGGVDLGLTGLAVVAVILHGENIPRLRHPRPSRRRSSPASAVTCQPDRAGADPVRTERRPVRAISANCSRVPWPAAPGLGPPPSDTPTTSPNWRADRPAPPVGPAVLEPNRATADRPTSLGGPSPSPC